MWYFSTYLCHHGIKGQKWGVRRYQNYDRTRTEEGKIRYRTGPLFISGSSKTTEEGGKYQRKKLPKAVRKEIDKAIRSKQKIVVGDAPGIDRQVQDYLKSKDYNYVEVYGPGKQVRYSANSKWKTNAIDAPEFEEFTKEWLAKKDIAMSEVSEHGLAIILDEGSSATRRNIDRLIEQNKDVKVYQLSGNGPKYDKWVDYFKLKGGEL
ncbi:MAG: hypothetical protein J6U54_09565 [Clostridiales bacterium]|nr:hypothetical protein [Clostridiales bacterium]